MNTDNPLPLLIDAYLDYINNTICYIETTFCLIYTFIFTTNYILACFSLMFVAVLDISPIPTIIILLIMAFGALAFISFILGWNLMGEVKKVPNYGVYSDKNKDEEVGR